MKIFFLSVFLIITLTSNCQSLKGYVLGEKLDQSAVWYLDQDENFQEIKYYQRGISVGNVGGMLRITTFNDTISDIGFEADNCGQFNQGAALKFKRNVEEKFDVNFELISETESNGFYCYSCNKNHQPVVTCFYMYPNYNLSISHTKGGKIMRIDFSISSKDINEKINQMYDSLGSDDF